MPHPFDVRGALEYEGLSKVLSTLGIDISADALEVLGRRYALPRQSGGVCGRRIWFTRQEVDRWLWHLADVTLDERLAQIPLDGRPDPRVLRRVRRTNVNRTPQSEFPRPLYAVCERTAEFGEQVFREDHGQALVELGAVPLDGFPVEGVRSARAACWRYDRARRARPGDLATPGYVARRREELPASTLVAAIVKDGARWRFVRVPGSWFGLARGTVTAAISSNRHPFFMKMIADIRKHDPAITFVAWTARVAVQPITFEPWPPQLPLEELLGA